jgi:hypothetical protein
MRVKELAQQCNSFTEKDYAKGLKVLYRLQQKRWVGIAFRRGGAYTERVPQASRQGGDEVVTSEAMAEDGEPYCIGAEQVVTEFGEQDLYREKDHDEDERRRDEMGERSLTKRFRIVAYGDAAFAVNQKMQSVSGWIVYVNGSPILFGSMRQSVVVDSSCAAEYVAASIVVKKIKEMEQMLDFLEITCVKPYRMYTDSTACRSIASNPNSVGKVRHLSIRTHMIRCYVSIGDIELVYCVTEAMVADLMTKIVVSSQDLNLAFRFYNDCDMEGEVHVITPKTDC